MRRLGWLLLAGVAGCLLQTQDVPGLKGDQGEPGRDSSWAPGDEGAIYYAGGKVGIGSPVPRAKIDVSGGGALVGNWGEVSPADIAQRTLLLGPRPDSPQFATLGFQVDDAERGAIGYDGVLGMSFGAFDSVWKTQMVISKSGNVGIGTAKPSADGFPFGPVLDVVGSRASVTIRTTEKAGIATLRITGPGADFVDDWHINMHAGNNSTLRIVPRAGALNSVFAISNDGNVGIGTTTPAVALDVVAGPGVAVSVSDGDPGHALGIYGNSHVDCVGKPCVLAGQSGWLRIRVGAGDKYVPIFD